MPSILNISGSILLILAGVAVAIYFFKEKADNPMKKSINFKNWIWISVSVLVVRWIAFIVCYFLFAKGVPFGDYIYSIFSKSGDSPHYLHIAEHGYMATGDKANLIVFYPLYPLLIKIFSFVFQDYFISGLIVSNLAFAAGACLFYELLRLDFDDKKAIYGLVLLCVAPYSLFYGALFTESVFLLTTVACLYFMRTKKPVLMAVFGFLACLSRTQGVILFFCAVVAFLSDTLKNKKICYENKELRIILKKEDLKFLLCTIIIALGFVVYLSINKILFDDWFKYLEFQSLSPWYNKAQWFGKTLGDSYNRSIGRVDHARIIFMPQVLLFYIGTLSIYYGIFKKIRSEYLVYTGIYIYTCYTHGWLISGSRYMCACVPLFIIFASCKNKYVKIALIALSTFLYFVITRMWLKGAAIM